MVFYSNELDMLVLPKGEQGVPGKSNYMWVKYSNSPNGDNMTDDPTNALYIGISYNQISPEESWNASDYTWTRFRGDNGTDGNNGLDAYTVILSNENISFVTDTNRTSLSDQTYECAVVVFYGTTPVTEFTIGEIANDSNLDISVSNHTISLSLTSGTVLSNDYGSISIPIIVGDITFNKNISFSIAKQGIDGKEGKPSISVSLGNESQTIVCSNDGKTIENISITIPFGGYKGLDRTVCSVSSPTSLPSGMTIGEIVNATKSNDGRIVFVIAKDSTLDNLLQGTISLSFTIEERVINKIFSWAKAIGGENGESPTVYELEPSTLVIKKGNDNVLSPATVLFKSYSKTGVADRVLYTGNFVVSESTDGAIFETKEIVESHSSYEYTPSSSNVKAIRCVLCEDKSVSKELDVQTTVILTDIDNIEPTLTEIRNEISGVSSKVNNVEKSITDEVWKNSIVKVVDADGNVVDKTIESLLTTHQTDINGITSRVSSVETNTNSLTEKYTKYTQENDKFVSEVKETYVKNTALEEKANELLASINDKNKVFQSQPVPPYSENDLWIKSDGDERIMYRCVNSKESGEYSDSDWVLALTYQTGTQVSSAITQKANEIMQKVETIDGNVSTLTTNVNGIEGKVTDNENNITNLQLDSQKITAFIGNENLDGSTTLEATMNGLETTVKKYTDDKETALEAKIQINADAISQRITSADAASLIKQESEKISSTVSDSISGLQSQIEQDAESVKATFNKLGMYDENASDPYNPDNSEKSCSSTLVTVDYDGLSVEGNSESGERIKTVIKNGIYGYNSSDENIFYLDQEGCHTGRVYMDRGFEAIGMKMVPTVINGVNTLCYVKIGGNS